LCGSFLSLSCMAPHDAGKEEIDQLDKIFQIMGTPNSESWPGIEKLPT